MSEQDSLQSDADPMFFDTSEHLDQMPQENDSRSHTVQNECATAGGTKDVPPEEDESHRMYCHLLPPELKMGYYDALIFYRQGIRKDRRGALKVLERIRKDIILFGEEKPKVALFDEIFPGIGMTPPEMLDQVVRRCNVKLFYITKDFCTDTWSKFSSSVCLNRAIRDPSQRCTVMPIFTAHKYNCEYADLIPLTLQPLDGMDLYNGGDIAASKLRKTLEGGLYHRKEQNRILSHRRKDFISEKVNCDRRENEKRNRQREIRKQQEAERERKHLQKMQEKDKNNKSLDVSNAETDTEDYLKYDESIETAECCPSSTPYSSGGSSFVSCNADSVREIPLSRAMSRTQLYSLEALSMTVTVDHDEANLPTQRNAYSAKGVTSDKHSQPSTNDTPLSQDTMCSSSLGSTVNELRESLSSSASIDGVKASMPIKTTFLQATDRIQEGISERCPRTSSDKKSSVPAETGTYDKPNNKGPLQHVSVLSNTNADYAPKSSLKENVPSRTKESKQGNSSEHTESNSFGITRRRETDKTTVEKTASTDGDTVTKTHVPCENTGGHRIATSPYTSLNEKPNHIAGAGGVKNKTDADSNSETANKGPGIGKVREPLDPLQKENLEEDDTTCSGMTRLSLTANVLEDEKERSCSGSFRARSTEEENENRDCYNTAKENEYYSPLPTYMLSTTETPSPTVSGSGDFKTADTSQSEADKADADNVVTGTFTDCNSTDAGCANAEEYITAPQPSNEIPPGVTGLEDSVHESYAFKNEQTENTNSDHPQDNADNGDDTEVKTKFETTSDASFPQSNKSNKETATDDMCLSEATVEPIMYNEGPGRKPSTKTGSCPVSNQHNYQGKTHSLLPASPTPTNDASIQVMVGRHICEVHHHYYHADANSQPEAKHEPQRTIINIHTAQSVIVGEGNRVVSHQKVNTANVNNDRQIVREKDEFSQQSDAEESLGDDVIEEITGVCAKTNCKWPFAHRQQESGYSNIYDEDTASNKASTGDYDETTCNRLGEKEPAHLVTIVEDVQTETHLHATEEKPYWPGRMMNLKEPPHTFHTQEIGDNEDTASNYMAATESDQHTVAKSTQRSGNEDEPEEQMFATADAGQGTELSAVRREITLSHTTPKEVTTLHTHESEFMDKEDEQSFDEALTGSDHGTTSAKTSGQCVSF